MIFIIRTNDEVAGLDITNALLLAGIQHTILSKQNDNAAQQGNAAELNATRLPNKRMHPTCYRCFYQAVDNERNTA